MSRSRKKRKRYVAKQETLIFKNRCLAPRDRGKAIAIETCMVIYGLVNLDAAPDAIRYIGKTCRPLGGRVRKHQQRAIAGCRSRKAAWIRAVLNAGHRVGAVVLATASSPAELDRLEREFIATYRARVTLLNATDGGEGGVLDAQTRERIRATLRGHPVSDETRAKMRAAGIGRRLSTAAREKLRVFNRGKTLAPGHRAKITAAQRGKTRPSPSAETLAKRGPAISAAKRGKALTPAHCDALRKAWALPDVRAKRCAALREAWKRRRARAES